MSNLHHSLTLLRSARATGHALALAVLSLLASPACVIAVPGPGEGDTGQAQGFDEDTGGGPDDTGGGGFDDDDTGGGGGGGGGTTTGGDDTGDTCQDDADCNDICIYEVDDPGAGICSKRCESFADCPSFWDCADIGAAAGTYCVPG